MTDKQNKQIAQVKFNLDFWRLKVEAPPIKWAEWPPPHPEEACARALFVATSAWRDWLKAYMIRGDAAIERHRPWGVITARKGYREKTSFFAVQIVLHEHYLEGGPEGAYEHVCEIDVDMGNPAYMAAVPLHGIEWLWHRVPKWLGRKKKFCGPFLTRKWWKRLRGWNIPDVRSL